MIKIVKMLIYIVSYYVFFLDSLFLWIVIVDRIIDYL